MPSSSSPLPSPPPSSSSVLLLPAHGHFFSSCSSRGLPSDSGVLTLSVRTMQVGRCRFSIKMSCCRSCLSSSIWVFSSAFMSSSRSDSCMQKQRRGFKLSVGTSSREKLSTWGGTGHSRLAFVCQFPPGGSTESATETPGVTDFVQILPVIPDTGLRHEWDESRVHPGASLVHVPPLIPYSTHSGHSGFLVVAQICQTLSCLRTFAQETKGGRRKEAKWIQSRCVEGPQRG